MHAVVTISDSF